MSSSLHHASRTSHASAPFSIAYLNGSRLQEALADNRVMAVIRFAAQTQVTADPRLFTAGLPELDGRDTIEVWRSLYPLQTGITESIRFVYNDTVLFAHHLIEEHDFPDLSSAAHAAYLRIFSFIRQQGYPYLCRVWNYYPHINQDDDGLERYQAFCHGRYQALEASIKNFEAKLPAACAIGTRSPGLLIYFLATKQPGLQIENPRQVSAFRYPRQYGPRSPSFSRALLKRWNEAESHLYISGTSSIVGHATQHAQNLPAQLEETLSNLQVLIERANRHVTSPFRLALLKIYGRYGLDTDRLRTQIRQQIGQRFAPQTPILLLRGDICRANLLIEADGIAISTTYR